MPHCVYFQSALAGQQTVRVAAAAMMLAAITLMICDSFNETFPINCEARLTVAAITLRSRDAVAFY
jgi:hypothetical protein